MHAGFLLSTCLMHTMVSERAHTIAGAFLF
jgi:hypothetical protein